MESYEADVTQTLFTRDITSPNDFYPDGFIHGPVVWPLAARLFPKGVLLRFAVRGRAGWGKFNEPIYSRTFKIEDLLNKKEQA